MGTCAMTGVGSKLCAAMALGALELGPVAGCPCGPGCCMLPACWWTTVPWGVAKASDCVGDTSEWPLLDAKDPKESGCTGTGSWETTEPPIGVVGLTAAIWRLVGAVLVRAMPGCSGSWETTEPCPKGIVLTVAICRLVGAVLVRAMPLWVKIVGFIMQLGCKGAKFG